MLSYRLFAAGTALAAGLTVFSGTASALSFGVGPLVGVNLGNSKFEVLGEDGKPSMLTRMAFGARAEFGVTTPFSLLLEPQFLQRGFSADGFDTNGVSEKGDFKLNYLELPILAKAKFGSMKAHAYVFAGPSLGLLLSADAEAGGHTESIDTSMTKFNLAGEIGVGGSYQLQEFIYLNADARYSYGFTNESKESDVTMDNRDIRFQLCVLFHLTK